ncbi:hypothetical protein ABIE66_003201 [Peribacillus sp. B2I2]|uniref:hypothetical protein n=1 Tax=Peribacillus sp. B2I2 TaxID=3156468 RepID=UPI003519B355
MTDNNNGAVEEFDRLAVIQELEQLKLKVARYETEVQPLADRELQRIKDEAVKQYRLTEEQAQVMADRLAELTNEQAINETALQLAGAFRATGKKSGADPLDDEYVELRKALGVRPFTRSDYKPVNTQYENGKQLAMNIHQRHGNQLTSIRPAMGMALGEQVQPSKTLSRFNLPRKKGVLGRWVDKFR